MNGQGSDRVGMCGGGRCTCAGEVHPVAAAAAAMLDQCAAFVREVPSETYTRPSQALQGGTIGKHVRHTLDHFRAALAGAEEEVIDYDHRERNVPMETEPREALAAIEALRRDLLGLTKVEMASPVRIRVMIAGDGTEAELGSTLARELAFASHHAVHHHAMLGAIAAELGMATGPEFGKAPSTISYERAQR